MALSFKVSGPGDVTGKIIYNMVSLKVIVNPRHRRTTKNPELET
jgi:hypothetical protein